MSPTIESDLGLEGDEGGEIGGLGGGVEAVEGGVQVGDVGGVVFLVMNLHDFGGNDRFQGRIVIGQVGKGVFEAFLDESYREHYRRVA